LFKDGHSEFKSQRDIKDIRDPLSIHTWIEFTRDKYPLPNDARWFMCSEESSHYVIQPLNTESGFSVLVDEAMLQVFNLNSVRKEICHGRALPKNIKCIDA